MNLFHMLQRLLHFVKAAIRANLLAGVLFLMPLAATFYFIHFLVTLADKSLLLLPQAYRPENFLPFPVPGLGVILVFTVLLACGALVRNWLGRKFVALGEWFVGYIPFVSKVYKAVKQLIETIFLSSSRDFKRVVLVEYPRKGVYALGFVTGVAMGEIQDKTDKRCINLFLPTTPNPTSGFYLIIPEDDVVPLDMSVEDAFKVLMSGGILSPDDKNKNSGFSPAASQAGINA